MECRSCEETVVDRALTGLRREFALASAEFQLFFRT
jgi:hypothetical protein